MEDFVLKCSSDFSFKYRIFLCQWRLVGLHCRKCHASQLASGFDPVPWLTRVWNLMSGIKERGNAYNMGKLGHLLLLCAASPCCPPLM